MRRSTKTSGQPAQPKRRMLLQAGAAATLVSPWESNDARVVQAPPRPEGISEKSQTTAVSLYEGTNLAIACSPDRSTLAIDLQGILWTLPIAGGKAKRLTGYLDDIAWPTWSPDGKHIAFQSYRNGNFHIWTIAVDGTQLTQRTFGMYDCREPSYSPDGNTLAFASDLGGNYGIYALDLSTGARRVLADTENEDSEPAWSHDGTRIAFASGGNILSVAITPGSTPRLEAKGPSASAPAWTPTGQVSYRLAGGTSRDMRTSRLHLAGTPISAESEDVFPTPAIWLSETELLYAADGAIKHRSLSLATVRSIPFSATIEMEHPRLSKRKVRDFDSTLPRPVKGISFPVLSPDGTRIAFTALNQLWLLTIGNKQPVQLTDDLYAKIYPTWSPDGTQLVYSSDAAGKMDLWIFDLERRSARQLTQVPCALKQASWSPDGKTIACACQDGYINLVDAATGSLKRLVRQTVWAGKPSWSPTGKQVALAAVRPFSSRYREGVNAILCHDIASAESVYHSPAPGASLDVRNVNGPLWMPDGKSMTYTMEGMLWSSAVDERGRPLGPPQQLNNENADAISCSADGRRLLYLCNAKLRLMTLDNDSKPVRIEDVPLTLSWTLAKPAGTTVIHAGKMWDGVAETAKNDVDIIIVGNRIAAIEPHRSNRNNVSWIDASAQTVMPGLIDMHTHREMGNQFGNREPRIFSSFGITSTRGLSDNPYLALENKESGDAGARVGPRHFGTGDALDGRRVFWDGMRPIANAAHLERELLRAKELDYDLLKCYVRLPVAFQKRAIAYAHDIGIPITSHYLFPALGLGADGYEHMGGTSRFGYSRTGSALGTMYQDVLALSAAHRGFRTPTIFGLDAMLGDTPELVLTDPRVTQLFPSWERQPLLKAASGGASQPIPAVRRQVEAVVRMMAAGVRIVTGSDYPIVAPGISLHLNLRAMVRYGVRPVDALRTATSVPGSFLHPDLGEIAAGKLADLVIVDGDPLRDIADAVRVRAVVQGGFHHSVEALVSPYQGRQDGTVASAWKDGDDAISEAYLGTRLKLAANLSPLCPCPPIATDRPGDALATREGLWWHDARWIAGVRSSCCGPVSV